MTRDYFLIFQPTDRWYKFLFNKKHAHVCALIKDEYNWIYVEPTLLRLNVTIPGYDVEKNLPQDLIDTRDIDILKITVSEDHLTPNKMPLCLLTCVTMVKYFMGLKMFVFTPHGLFKKLATLSLRKREKCGITSITIYRKGKRNGKNSGRTTGSG